MDISITNFRHTRTKADPNATRLDFGPVTVWFSYTTPIAFLVSGRDKVVRVNDWRVTTGKHINAVDGGTAQAKKARIKGEDFTRQLNGLLARFFFPKDLDKDAPPEVVSDWLRDRGMDEAADAVMSAKK